MKVKFQNSAKSYLTATFQWCRSDDADGKKNVKCFDHNDPPGVFKYAESTYQDTELTITANSETAGYFYWAKLEYNKKLLSTGTSDKNILESSKVYLVLDGKITENQKTSSLL